MLSNKYPEKLSATQESKLISYIDENLLRISGRFIRRNEEIDPETQYLNMSTNPFKSIEEVVIELNSLVDLLTVTGRVPVGIQSEYLIQIADNFNNYITGFEPISENEPASIKEGNKALNFIEKLDLNISQLINGTSKSALYTKDVMSRTQIVRIESIVEQTRIILPTIVFKDIKDPALQLRVASVYERFLELVN